MKKIVIVCSLLMLTTGCFENPFKLGNTNFRKAGPAGPQGVAGPQGETGVAGKSPLMVMERFATTEECNGAGVLVIAVGIDVNGNSELDGEEVQSESYVCDGKNGEHEQDDDNDSEDND